MFKAVLLPAVLLLSMDVDYHDQPAPVARAACCVCGRVVDVNPSNMCPTCITANVDIAEGLIKDYTIVHCPECERYLQPPKYWTKADLESRELMTICLKKIKGLQKYHLVDATFLWTEPHSKRLKVKICLQKEIFASTVVQQNVVIEFVVQWQQCERCAKVATGQPQWDAVVQLRQKVEHRRTFFYLEQLILKHRMHENVTRIQAHPDGLDFFFGHKSHANAFVDFVGRYSPTIRRDAVQLVSHDTKSNVAVRHHTFSIEVAPCCREDLICLPPALHKASGAIGPIVLVHKVFSSIVFIDPVSLRAWELDGTVYWKNAFDPLASTRQLAEFFVVDIERTGVVNGKYSQARATICLSSEVGTGREWVVLTHLGNVLNIGDLAKGYLVSALNHNNDEISKYRDQQIPDVVLVHKHFPAQATRRNKRQWRLRRLVEDDTKDASAARDYEEFCDTIERDKEFRADIQLYKAPLVSAAAPAVPTDGPPEEVAAAPLADDDTCEVDVAELLDELTLEEADKPQLQPVKKRNREAVAAPPTAS